MIYPVDSAIQLLNNWGQINLYQLDNAIGFYNTYPLDIYQTLVVQKLDSAIHRVNHYPADSAIDFRSTYPLDSDLSGGWRYPTFEPRPGG